MRPWHDVISMSESACVCCLGLWKYMHSFSLNSQVITQNSEGSMAAEALNTLKICVVITCLALTGHGAGMTTFLWPHVHT